MGELKVLNTRAEASVGTLVWVRRRNGSWWPGRILGPEELPGSHLLSPRSGTPVKLLGREDASVDWYNIEKSKRVKAFRCGEFDDCIERAKTFAGLPTKKREKYARREDAILHALEMEQQHLELEQLSGLLPDERELGDHTNQPVDRGLGNVIHGNGQVFKAVTDFEGFESPTCTTQPILSVPKSSLENLAGLMVPQRKTESDWEDDITEATPRMRGLQDFGLRIAPSKRKKANWSSAFEGASKLSLTEDDSRTISCISKSMGIGGLPNSSKGSSFSLKRKRSQVGPVPEESAFKRRDRRRPLTQVLESSAKLSELGFHDFEPASKGLILCPVEFEERLVAPQLQERKMGVKVEHFTDSDGLESQSVRQNCELGHPSQDACGSKQDSFNTVSAVDKACSSISDHLNASCCDRRPLHLPLSVGAAPLAGSIFVDSLLRGGPAPTCSFLSVSAHTGSATSVNDNGLDKSSSISMPSVENLPYSANFQLWSNSNFKEAICNRSCNGLGMVRSSERAPWIASCLPYNVNNVPARNSLPINPFYAKNLQDHRALICKRNANVLETSSFPLTSPSEDDSAKVRRAFPSQGPLSAGDSRRGHMVGEDEAESFRVSTGLSTVNCIPVEGVTKSVYLEQFEPLEGVLSPGSNEGRDETGFCNLMNKGSSTSHASHTVANCTVSKWQAKGRRNARVPGRWPVDGFYRRNFFGSAEELEHGQEKADKQRDADWRCSLEGGASARIDYVYSGCTESTRPLQCEDEGVGSLGDYRHAVPYSKWNNQDVAFPSVPKFHESRNMIDVEHISRVKVTDSTWVQRRGSDVGQSKYWKHTSLQQESWFDVQVEVQASYQGEHVPLVSLMSRLNGKAVVGHPVVVERLESRYRINLTGTKNGINLTGTKNGLKKVNARLETLTGSKGKKVSLQPTWKTARRTAMLRVPRSCTSVVGHEIDDGMRPFLKQTGQPMSKLGFSFYKRRLLSKSHPLVCRSVSGKKLSKKLLKKTGFPLQKTRTLSSFAADQNVRHEHIEKSASPVYTSEKPTLACIPVKLVFKRIREVLYGQPQPVLSDVNRRVVDTPVSQEPS